MPLTPGTSAYGDAFGHFIILECIRLASYYYPEYRFSYLRTKDDAEVDLIVERPREKILFIEIKSIKHIKATDLSTFISLTQDFGECEVICLSQDIRAKHLEHVLALPWQQGIKRFFMPC